MVIPTLQNSVGPIVFPIHVTGGLDRDAIPVRRLFISPFGMGFPSEKEGNLTAMLRVCRKRPDVTFRREAEEILSYGVIVLLRIRLLIMGDELLSPWSLVRPKF